MQFYRPYPDNTIYFTHPFFLFTSLTLQTDRGGGGDVPPQGVLPKAIEFRFSPEENSPDVGGWVVGWVGWGWLGLAGPPHWLFEKLLVFKSLKQPPPPPKSLGNSLFMCLLFANDKFQMAVLLDNLKFCCIQYPVASPMMVCICGVQQE